MATFAWVWSNGTTWQPISSAKRYRDGIDCAPLRARRTIPASSNETEHDSRIEGLSWWRATPAWKVRTARLRPVRKCRLPCEPDLAGNTKFVVSKNFVISARIQNWQCGDLPADGIYLIEIDRASRSAQLLLERVDYRVGKSHTHSSAHFSARL